MHPTETDNLTLAVVAWFNMVAPQLNAEQSEVMRVNRRWNGTPYRHPKGTPLIGVFCW
jgi:hypothetical protein